MIEGRAEVEILGQRLSVRGRGTPEYIRELAAYLNGRVEGVQEQGRLQDPLRLSLLAGLHLADELFRSREGDREIAARLDRLLERLDRILAEGGGSGSATAG
ncbi:MAG TPA: cell division protein ZapA [Methylomirabilota bacterium]|jgi:cell division protein ZapA (FtsZ GTPase activity inhibitor)|nr:cell division protein ZapA [Methylomirabilota bacterium]